MPPTSRLRVFALAITGLLLAPAGAWAATGGTTASEPVPEIDSARCATGTNWKCSPGQRLRLRGSDLAEVHSVAFIGGAGGADDRFARPRRAADGVVTVDVPAGARTGRLRVRSDAAVTRTRRSVRVPDDRRRTQAPAPGPAVSEAAPERVSASSAFPIDGRHDMGQSATNAFGGGRGHQGHDLFAACGTPLVAVGAATVQHVAYHSAAGHYVVLSAPDKSSFAYMHLQSRPRVSVGDRVRAGQRLGEVGQTGRASGCHLHFEQWTAPGWYAGGRPVDPMPLLRRLERDHSHA